MKLVIMTKPTFFVEEDKILATLFDEGMENLHLYKPGSSPMYSERLLSLLPEDYYDKITVHDHYYLKQEYGLSGIHLDDLSTEKPEKYKGHISCTVTTIEQLQEVKKKFNYIFLRNIFDNISDENQKSSFTIDELKQASRRGLIDKKVYAAGGVGIDNLKIVKELGFGGAVVCGDLWNRFDIHNELNFKQLISHFEKLRKSVS